MYRPQKNSQPSSRQKQLFKLLLPLCLVPLVACNPAPPQKSSGPGAPTSGLYRCWAGGFDHLPAGSITLASNGHYESYRPHGGGHYAFTPTSSTIDFLDGDYNYWEYRGIVQHEPKNRIVLIPLDDTAPIGTERPGEYQYCYQEP